MRNRGDTTDKIEIDRGGDKRIKNERQNAKNQRWGPKVWWVRLLMSCKMDKGDESAASSSENAD